MNKIIIEAGSYMDKIIYAQGDQIQRFDFLDKSQSIREGQIYKGIVKSLSKGMNSALVDLGEGKVGYLQEKNISEVLKNSQEIMVQVKRESIEEKYPKLTRDISLLGNFLILLPFSKGIKLSKKMEQDVDVNSIRTLLDEKMGVILRSNIADRPVDMIKKEYEELVAQWQEISGAYDRVYSKGLLFEYDFAYKFILDSGISFIDTIFSNDNDLLKKLNNQLKEKISIRQFKKVDTEYVFDYCHFSTQFQYLFQKKIQADQNVSIIIEHTEAFTVIDVNSGGTSRHADFEKNILEANKIAAKEIVRQIILRDIAGVILIDFIDMKSEKNRQELVHYFKRETRQDTKHFSVLSMTELGILQVVRKKERSNLLQRATEICPHCAGTGRIFSSSFRMEENNKADLMRNKHQ